MSLYPKSLKQKVILGYFIGLLLMLAVVAVNWIELRNVEDMVISGQVVSDFFDTTLEIRRYEKNYFLYGKEEDYKELLGYVERAESLLEGNKGELERFVSPGIVSNIEKDIGDYAVLLKDISKTGDGISKTSIERKLREKGRTIVTVAEGISKSERRIIQGTLQSSRHILAMSIIFLVSVFFIAGALFYRMFIKPLQHVERHMNKIAEGEFALIPVGSRDREMVSLSRAFNRMLVELETRQTHLVQSEKLASMGTLLFSVAHELNNPLSNISTSCQILKEEIEEADIEYKKELLQQIDGETDRAKDIVRSILDYSRAGKKEKFNLNTVVGESIRFIKADVPSKIELDVNIPEDITLFADKQKLQQVFLNLIKNAVEAIQGEGRVYVTARKAKDNLAEIEFADTGAGMDAETVSKIFDPFFTTKETKGHGLGLFVVHKIIEDHAGSIDVESTKGHGTTFLIKLPLMENKNNTT